MFLPNGETVEMRRHADMLETALGHTGELLARLPSSSMRAGQEINNGLRVPPQCEAICFVHR